MLYPQLKAAGPANPVTWINDRMSLAVMIQTVSALAIPELFKVYKYFSSPCFSL